MLTDSKGIDKVLEKVGEESTEFILAAKNGIKKRTTEEASDLLFHLLVALCAAGYRSLGRDAGITKAAEIALFPQKC